MASQEMEWEAYWLEKEIKTLSAWLHLSSV